MQNYITQSHRVQLSTGESKDFYPKGSGTVIQSSTFIDAATKEYRAVPDGALTNASDAAGKHVFRLTAAADMDGHFVFTEVLAVYPDPVVPTA